jgi:cell division septum initiation protein DivIVA
MTWLLAKLGLSMVDGKTLGPLLGFAAAVVLAFGLAAYVVHTLTKLGAESAMAECKAATQQAKDEAAELRTQNAEASREVIIKHAADSAARPAALAAAKQEVADDATNNPPVAACSLNDVGLRLWNRPIPERVVSTEDALHGGLNPGRRDYPGPGDAARSDSGRPRDAQAEPRGQQGSIPSAASIIQRAREASRAMLGKASDQTPQGVTK